MCAPTSASAQNGAAADPPSEAIASFIEPYAQLFKNGQRSPVLHRPSECGMPYE